MNAATPTPPRQVVFDPTPEIFATDTAGSFTFPLLIAGKAFLGTSAYDEVRFVFSIWHPSGQRTIDLDRAYVELRASFDPDEDHWTKIAEIGQLERVRRCPEARFFTRAVCETGFGATVETEDVGVDGGCGGR